MTTAIELIRDALKLTNAVGEDQQLTDSEAQDGLNALNDRLDEWSTQSLAIYGSAPQTFNTTNGQAVYTIGPGGNWNTARPIRINDPAYSTLNGVTFPAYSMTEGEYALITDKAQPQQFPYRYLYTNSDPLGLITLWPVPNQVTPITFSIDMLLASVPLLTTTLIFPPGYKQALKYQLACDLGPMFGRNLNEYPTVVAAAKAAFGNIKRANAKNKQRVMRSGVEYSDMGWWSNWSVWP